MRIVDIIHARRDSLTASERRAADVIARDPQLIAFGTVAVLAAEARTGGATVVRLTAKLGFNGFSDLQDRVRAELAERLHPAAERVRHDAKGDVVGRARTTTLDAVAASLDGLSESLLAQAVAVMQDIARPLWLIGGDDASGIVSHAAEVLAMARPGVRRVGGTPIAVARDLALVDAGHVVVVIDVRRYDRWLAEIIEELSTRGVAIVALTDSPLSPLAAVATVTIPVVTHAIGPFDSYVGVLAVLDTLIAAVVEADRAGVTARLDRIEHAWRDLLRD